MGKIFYNWILDNYLINFFVIIMSKINYVIREDSSETLKMAEYEWDFLDTEEILNDYPYILNSMQKDDYYLENDICSIFEEILFENKVVGFATFQLRGENTVLLTECFIMPEFRGKRLFFEEICKMNFVAPDFGILQPTRNVVELLVDYAFARNVTEDIVASAIEFYFDDFDAKSTKSRELDEDEMEPSNFYDLSINSTVLVDGDEVIYHNLLENDLRRHGFRKELTDDYFANLIDLFSRNGDEFNDVIFELKKELPQEKLGYEEIIGPGEGLSEYMQGVVDHGLISSEKAIEIRRQLIEEYESGEIDDDTIDDRFTFLVASGMTGSMDLESLEEFMDDADLEGEDLQLLNDFFDVIGDDEDLASNLLNALISDDAMAFENLLLEAMNKDEEFANNFLELAESLDDDEDDDFDFESLGLNLDSRYPVAEMMWGNYDDKYKLDDTFYGKDYPVCEDIYIYRILNFLKNNGNLELALMAADMRGAATSQIIENYLFENDFIDGEVNYGNWNEFAHESLTISDLKDVLRENNLRVSGKKQELIDRVAENQIPLDGFRLEKVSVTPKGDEFLQNNEWIGFYDMVLNKFDFNDFVKYLDNNEGEFRDVTLDYISEHLELAQKEENPEYINDCVIVQGLLSIFDADSYKKFKYNG